DIVVRTHPGRDRLGRGERELGDERIDAGARDGAHQGLEMAVRARGAVHRNGGNAVAIIVHDPHPCWEPCLAAMPYPLAIGVLPNGSRWGGKRFNRVWFRAPWPGWSGRGSDNEKIVVIQHRNG